MARPPPPPPDPEFVLRGHRADVQALLFHDTCDLLLSGRVPIIPPDINLQASSGVADVLELFAQGRGGSAHGVGSLRAQAHIHTEVSSKCGCEKSDCLAGHTTH
jgi:hypothetical protein